MLGFEMCLALGPPSNFTRGKISGTELSPLPFDGIPQLEERFEAWNANATGLDD